MWVVKMKERLDDQVSSGFYTTALKAFGEISSELYRD